MSYTTFSYSNLQLNTEQLRQNESLTVTVEVSNTGKETVHLYTSDLYASELTPDVKRLRRFEKINLKPGEKQKVTFTLTSDDLSYTNRSGQNVVEPGDFEIRLGDQVKKFKLLE